jgi:hypothetical protein
MVGLALPLLFLMIKILYIHHNGYTIMGLTTFLLREISPLTILRERERGREGVLSFLLHVTVPVLHTGSGTHACQVNSRGI